MGRLVSRDVLSRHHQIEGHVEVLAGFGKQVAIDVGKNTQTEPLLQSNQRGVGVGEGGPGGMRTRQRIAILFCRGQPKVMHDGRLRRP